jgi:hypothetical protein
MHCETARKEVYLGNILIRLRAGLHLHLCQICRDWQTQQDSTGRMLSSLPHHSLPEGLEQGLRNTWRGIMTNEMQVQHTGNIGTAVQTRPRRRTLVRALALGTLVIIAGLIAMLTGNKQSTVACAQMTAALQKVQVVHITGFDLSIVNNIPMPMSIRKDKWLQREPFAMHEELTHTGPNSTFPDLTVVADTEKRYWYTRNGKSRNGKVVPPRVIITKSLNPGFFDEITSLQGWQSLFGTNGELKIERYDQLNGKQVAVVSPHDDSQADGSEKAGSKYVLWVDPDRQLILRMECFLTEKDKSVKESDLMFDYDVPIPPGAFEFTPPSGVEIIDRLHEKKK